MKTLHPTEWTVIQRKLFIHLKSMVESRSHYAFVEELQSLLNIRKTAAYKRMSGVLPLRMPELLTLMQQYDIRIQDYMEDPGAAYLKLAENRTSGLKKYFNMLLEINREVRLQAASRHPVCHYSSPSMPLLLFAGRPELVYFHWFSEMYFQERNPIQTEYQPTILTTDPKFLGLLNSTQQALKQMELHIMTGPGCFDIQLSRLRHLVEIQKLSVDKAQMLLHQLSHWLRELHAQCESGRKGFHLWYCQHFTLNDEILMQSSDHQSMISQLFSAMQSSSSNQELLRRISQQHQYIMEHACLLSRGNGTQRKIWFRELEQKIRRVEQRLPG